MYCLASVLASVVENGSTSVFLVPAQPGIQHDLDLRGDGISKGCICNSELLNPCYHDVPPVFRVVVLWLRGALFFLHCVVIFYSVKIQWHMLPGRHNAQILCGNGNFFVWCGPEGLLQICLATIT